jgi:hypothetical protein
MRLPPYSASNLIALGNGRLAVGVSAYFRNDDTTVTWSESLFAVDTKGLPERIDHWDLFEDHFLVLAAKGSPLADMDRVPISALAEATWLERTGCEMTRKFWDMVFADGRRPTGADTRAIFSTWWNRVSESWSRRPTRLVCLRSGLVRSRTIQCVGPSAS